MPIGSVAGRSGGRPSAQRGPGSGPCAPARRSMAILATEAGRLPTAGLLALVITPVEPLLADLVVPDFHPRLVLLRRRARPSSGRVAPAAPSAGPGSRRPASPRRDRPSPRGPRPRPASSAGRSLGTAGGMRRQLARGREPIRGDRQAIGGQGQARRGHPATPFRPAVRTRPSP